MDAFLAEIRIYPFSFAPKNWAFCNGQIVPISQNTALFSLLGTTYGGNGTTNFALPQLQGNVPMGAGSAPGLTPRALGESGGTTEETITVATMPAHTHSVLAAAPPASLNQPSNTTGIARSSGGTIYNKSSTGLKAMDSKVLSDFTGGNLPHPNMQPYLAVNFCICMQGIFPPRG